MSMFCPPPWLLQNAYQHFVLAPNANPYAYRWRLIDQREGVGFISYIDAPRSIAQQIGSQIHPGDNPDSDAVRIEPSVHHVSISPCELAVTAEEATDPLLPTTVRSEGNTASLLKARITVALTNSRLRVFDFDIGAGVEFNVWAQSVQKIEVLIPDPDFPPVIPDLIPDRQLAAVITTAVYRCQLPTYRMPLTYSIALTLVAEPAIVPVVAAARDVAIYSDEPATDANDLVVEFLYVFGEIPEVQYGAIADPVAILGAIVLPVGATHIPATLIPGQANAMRITRTFGSDDTVVNVVQVLNV